MWRDIFYFQLLSWGCSLYPGAIPGTWILGFCSANLDAQARKKGKLTMKIRSLLTTAILALTILATANAKSYELQFETSMKAGKVQLKPGKYHLELRGNDAVFTDTHGGSQTTPVKVDNGTKKFPATGVDSVADQIKSISLGGSTMTLEFIE